MRRRTMTFLVDKVFTDFSGHSLLQSLHNFSLLYIISVFGTVLLN